MHGAAENILHGSPTLEYKNIHRYGKLAALQRFYDRSHQKTKNTDT